MKKVLKKIAIVIIAAFPSSVLLIASIIIALNVCNTYFVHDGIYDITNFIAVFVLIFGGINLGNILIIKYWFLILFDHDLI